VSDAALAAWLSAAGRPLSAEFDALVVRAQADIDDRDLSGLAEECRQLGGLAADLDSSPPPGSATEVADAWDRAAGYAGGAATDCTSAIQTQSLELIRGAVAQVRSAAASLTVAITAAEALTA
jgi:hypothetical protein